MKTLIILMFIMLIVLLALNVTLYLNFNKRLNNLRSLCTTSFNDFIKESTDVYSHINSIYQTIKDLMNTVSKFKTVLDVIELKSDNIVNNITTYVHKDNDNRNKEIINCLANTSNDLRTLISDVNKRVLDLLDTKILLFINTIAISSLIRLRSIFSFEYTTKLLKVIYIKIRTNNIIIFFKKHTSL